MSSDPACSGDQPSDDDIAALPDLSSSPICALSAQADNTVLSRSLRQVIRSLDDPNGVISAFDSFANA